MFCFISDQIEKLDVGHKVIYTTHLSSVLSTSSTELTAEIQPCNHEESDTRMLIHAAHATRHGHTKVVLRTVDTDVLVIAISQMSNLGLAEIWLEFGVSKHYRVISVHNIVSSVGYEKASALPFFHALTGCDTTSAFAGRSKRSAWDTWKVFPEITSTFTRLSKSECALTDEILEKIEEYVVLLYSKTSEAKRVNEARQQLFAKGTRSLENIPPTQGALVQHVRRAVIQAGYIWGQALNVHQEVFSPTEWGWKDSENGLIPNWKDLPEASVACEELICCSCKKSCQGKSKCFRANLCCTTLCACAGHCSRQESM